MARESAQVSILVTGSTMLSDVHVERLERAGFTVDRLGRPDGTDRQLIDALSRKRAYVCAGMERVSAKVIAAADELEIIAFPGSGYTEFIPSWKEATERGIAISAQVGVNARSVAEFTFTLMLVMLRRLPALLRDVDPGPWPAREISSLTLGVVGFGHSGRQVAALAHSLGMTVIIAARRSISDLPDGMSQRPLNDLLSECDVVSVHVDRIHGAGVLGAAELTRLQRGALVLNVSFPDAVEWTSLKQEILAGNVRAAYDAPPDGEWRDLAASQFLALSRQAAFDTIDSNDRISDGVVDALLAFLNGRPCPTIVNPEYVVWRQKRGTQ
jgi:phosphoglycerate dehydrogenase-like enzyme